MARENDSAKEELGRRPARSGPSHYLHGTSAKEQRRLSLMNDVVNRGSLAELGVRGGERILEFGSGLGQMARAMARAAGPGGRVVGIERSRAQLAEARRLARAAGEEHLVDLRLGDASAPPLRPGEWGSFDVAHGRFILEHVPDPLAVVRAMVRAVRPGGRIVLEDDDHDVLRLWPEPPGVMALWRAYIRAFESLGNDPYVGRRLVSLLHRAGAAPRRNTWIFFGSCAGHPDFPLLVGNLLSLLRGARAGIVNGDLLDDRAFEAATAAVEDWSGRPDAAFWYAIAWAEGIRPEAGRRSTRRGTHGPAGAGRRTG
ncbi:MAG: methyltransferase domain-containing protein [Acidobacteria bacterium]|nr:methyltransferase domain-containing protein [Acidobacteriota bacterium]